MRRALGPIAMLIACVLLPAKTADAQFVSDREYQIKAAFLYNFVKFVRWEDEGPAPSPIRICVLGEDPFGPALDALRGKTARGRTVAVARVSVSEALRECQVAFISSSERDRVPQIVESLETAGVLTVGETEGFLGAGGVINFVPERNKIRFEINVGAAEKAGLRISSKLLNVAKAVR